MRIHILGASGSGVTTLGKALAEELNYSYFDSDAYFWLPSEPPFINRRRPLERNALLTAEISQYEDWVLGGSMYNWNVEPLFDFDLVVFLWLPPTVRLQRLRDREYARYGDIIYNDPERKQQYEKFITWAQDYDIASGLATRNIKAHEAWLETLSVPILQLRGDLTVHQRLDAVLQAMDELRNMC